MNSKKTGSIVSVVVLFIVYGFYNSWQKSKHDAIMSQSYQNIQKRKAREDSIKDYNIDSFLAVLKGEKDQHIVNLKYTPADSGIFMVADPEFDYTNRYLADSMYSAWYHNHQFNYAKNISAITVCKTFTKKQADDPNFEPPLIWFAAKPGSQIYNQWKETNPGMIK